MKKFICIHGHFYQPPRDNPWLEAVETEESAHPYHDWNERINEECYAANALSRLLDERGRIKETVNNYERMSFNFGPTLLSWMQTHAPETYEAILEADRLTRERFGGHGSALAQCYNHLIMPLASKRDKRTQVVWGKRDFSFRFGREPEGMWLPETAVDQETLEILAEEGFRFTVLGPHQAEAVRRRGEEEFRTVSEHELDCSAPYLVRLPSGRSIAVFFYHGPLSRAVAFEGLLEDGEQFARALLGGFIKGPEEPELLSLATDGETYGHHHRFGNMALTFATERILSEGKARLGNFGWFLDLYPPQWEARIRENSSWSCPHGVERWRADCGCATGQHPEWSQAWRSPLREAMDRLRDLLAEPWEREAEKLLQDPWAARDDYISVILDRSEESVERFFARNAGRALSPGEKTTALKLMEMQRHAMLMFTSCGWFFDDLAGLESVQVMKYAARVMELARETLGLDLEPEFLRVLERAKSNAPEAGNGREIFLRRVKSAKVGLPELAAHYAASSVFDEPSEREPVYSYLVSREDLHREEAGRASLITGRALVCSLVTREEARFEFGVLHLGDHNLSGGVRVYRADADSKRMKEGLAEKFGRGDFPAVLRELDLSFPAFRFDLTSLLRDRKREILSRLVEEALAQGEEAFRAFFEANAAFMRFMAETGNPLPPPFKHAAEFAISRELKRSLERELDLPRFKALLDEAEDLEVALDREELSLALGMAMKLRAQKLLEHPERTSLLRELLELFQAAELAKLSPHLWKTQNLFLKLLKENGEAMRDRAEKGEAEAEEWLNLAREAAARLSIVFD